MKGETIEEITACALRMRKHCVKLLQDQDVLEIVGTGGDKSNSFNISTTSSLVISAAGVPVAKHGNRAASSKSMPRMCWSLWELRLQSSLEKSAELLKDRYLLFVCAELSSVHEVCGTCQERADNPYNLLNILGPLYESLPSANMELMGVYDEKLVEPLARVLANLGVKSGMVVFGQ